MGEFFTSFLERTEPLDGFFVDFPDDESAFPEGWLVEPSDEIKAAARPLQESLARFPWPPNDLPRFLQHMTVVVGGAARLARLGR